MNTIDTIINRHSYRGVYKQEKIPRKDLMIIVEAGLSAPAMICVLTRKIYAYRDKCFSVQDYSAAIENMLLAIIELGYQSCWIEGHITDQDQIGHKMAKILNVPDEYDLVAFLPVGIALEDMKPVKKIPFDQRAWFNSFGTNLKE